MFRPCEAERAQCCTCRVVAVFAMPSPPLRLLALASSQMLVMLKGPEPLPTEAPRVLVRITCSWNGVSTQSHFIQGWNAAPALHTGAAGAALGRAAVLDTASRELQLDPEREPPSKVMTHDGPHDGINPCARYTVSLRSADTNPLRDPLGTEG